MKKVVRLTESELIKIVKKVIKENKDGNNSLKKYMKNPVFKDFYTYLNNLATDVAYCENINDIEDISSEIDKLGIRIEREREFTEDMKEILYQEMIEISMDLDDIEDSFEDYDNEEEEDDDMPLYNTKWVMPSDDNK